jgi:hypothetical protein
MLSPEERKTARTATRCMAKTQNQKNAKKNKPNQKQAETARAKN